MLKNNRPDIVVIGGGSAGCAMAGRLAEQGSLSVLLIEAGSGTPSISTRMPAMVAKLVMNDDFDWCLPVEPDATIGGKAGVWPAGKRLGGGSSINGMMYIRGHARNYDDWAAAGADGWAYADCLPYFRRMETNPRPDARFHGQSGPMHVSELRLRYPVTDAWIESNSNAGIPRCQDLNGDGRIADGADYVQASQRNGDRWSTADGYVRNRDYGGRLEVSCEHRVRRVIVENGQAVGVVLAGADGAVQEVRSRHGVVLCAGTMGSPKLLMLSGIGPADHLAETGIDVLRDLPGVGANLQDHVGLHVVHEVNCRSMITDMRGLGIAKAGLEYLLRKTGLLTTAIGHAQAMIRTRTGLAAPNIQLIFAPFAFEMAENGDRPMPKKSSVSTLVACVHPGARGTITLRSADPDAPPVIRHELLGDPDDIEQIVEGMEAVRKIMAQPPISGMIVSETKPGQDAGGRDAGDRDRLREFVCENAMSLFHPIGTCRMGNGEDAVVGPDLKVRGVDRLWVADCSIMPSHVGANTNATAIMIGDKGADHVLASLGLRHMLPAEAAP
ncbi:MAG TPA: GMC family oxidoreductase N-terminal domain-containing protein [Devosia sp.]|nr:GMC family oxidoreductase N-terminal domain-containing protein [Devosia sp.]